MSLASDKLHTDYIAIIANIRSGKAKQIASNIHSIESVLTQHSIQFRYFPTTSLEELENAIAICKKYNTTRYILLGGDGSLHQLINALNRQEISLSAIHICLLPFGTGNDYIRNFRQQNISELINAFIQDKFQKVDIASIDRKNENPRLFVNMLGLGLNSEVLKRMAKYKFLGEISYYIGLIEAFICYKGIQLTLDIDGERQHIQGLIVSIGLGKYAGGNMKLCPNAILDDGFFDINIIPNLSFWKLLRNIHRLQDGSYLKYIPAKSFRAKTIRLISPESLDIEADGEWIEGYQGKINLMKQSLNICGDFIQSST